jgi:hypothetical protein
VDLVWKKGIFLGLDLNEEPMKVNGVDDQPTPIVKLPQACEYAQLLSKFAMKHPLKFLLVDVMNMQSFMDTQRECRIIIWSPIYVVLSFV